MPLGEAILCRQPSRARRSRACRAPAAAIFRKRPMTRPPRPPGTTSDLDGLGLGGATVSAVDVDPELGGPQEGAFEKEAAVLAAASQYRSLLLLRGTAALLFSFLVFFWPKLTITGLAMLWAGYSLADGSIALTAAIFGRSGTARVWLGLIGLAGITCAGGALIALDEVSGHLIWIISIWAISTGAMQVWVALKLRKAVDGEWILAFDGLGSLLFGVALALWPGLQVEALVWLTGWFAVALGSLFVSISLWLGRSS